MDFAAQIRSLRTVQLFNCRSNYCVPFSAITMTTLDSQADKTLCHLDNLSNTELAEIPSDHGLPVGISPLESRVAGHPLHDERQTIGKHPIELNATEDEILRKQFR